ncbi:DUF2303 family protein [Nocardia puris]|uniref:DUF2303 family protein n=1 Tax=Nocardia puris TaxID=208602 RepID=UPI0018957552|nr:DUF2303 family protein [Nocardia puris]MBF6459830.1 DUF2303 family protein [Nocardia puris]
MIDDYQTENAVAAELARESARFGTIRTPEGTDVHVNVLRQDERVLVESLEKFADFPRRDRGTSVVRDVASFAALLGLPGGPEAVIFADEARGTVTAILNYSGWRDHRITLELHQSEQLARWLAHNGRLVSQEAFVELIEDSVGDIVNPTAADMLEIAQSFEATKGVQFESGRRSQSGAVRFRYTEQIDARAGQAGDLEVPEQFTLHLPVWRGGNLVEVRASLRYRIGREGLRLGFKITSLDDLLRVAFDDIVRHVGSAIGEQHTVVRGPAPAAIDPLP